MGIDRKSGVGRGESGDRQEWGGKGRVGTDRKSGVGREECGDRQGVCSGEGREWG